MMNLDGNNLAETKERYALLEDNDIYSLLQKRGIISAPDKQEYENVINKIINILFDIDYNLENQKDNTLFRDKCFTYIQNKKIILGTPILESISKNLKQGTGACSIVEPIVNNGIVDMDKLFNDIEMFLSTGVGIGIDLSYSKDPVKDIKQIDHFLFELDEKLKKSLKRPVAVMITLNDKHIKLCDFITSKKDVDFNNSRVNLSILTSEIFFEKVQTNSDWTLEYEEEKETLSARDIFSKITNSIHCCGEPGFLFMDRFELDNSTPQWKYISTAPCAEVAMADKDACHFSYLNLPMFLTKKAGKYELDIQSFADAVSILTRFLDSVVEYTIQHNCYNQSIVEEKRRIGLGIAGFASMLIKMQIPYDSPEAIQLAKNISELISFHSKVESVKLSKKRGAFKALKNSLYIHSKWLKRKDHFHTGIIPVEKWNNLYQDILENGIRNASTTAFPPTGSSSILGGVSSSIEPYFCFYRTNLSNKTKYIPKIILSSIEEQYDKNETSLLIEQILNNKIDISKYPHFLTSCQINYNKQLEITKAFQNIADGSASKTVILPNNATLEDVERCCINAYKKGLKGISIFRQGCLLERNLFPE